MPVCSRIESTSWVVQGSSHQFIAVPHPDTSGSVNFVGILRRFLPTWTIREIAGGRIAGDARADLGNRRVQAETVLYLLETSVTIEDSADASHALRIHRPWCKNTDDSAHSDIGKLVRQAKPYDRASSPGDPHIAEQLAEKMLSWIEAMPPYANADIIVPAPSTNPDKYYDLPAFIAERLAWRTRKEVMTIRSSNTAPQKNLIPAEKASAEHLAQQYTVMGNMRDKVALVIDDIYETGATVNAMAQVLRKAGAAAVLSLTATKTAKECLGLAPKTANWPMEA